MDATKSVSASSQDTVNNLGMGDEGFYGVSPIGQAIETEFRYGAQDTQRRPDGGEHRKAEPDPFDSFAEGTFREPPGVLPFRMGAFLAAARADVPVIPVTLSGTRRLLPDLSLWPRYSKLTVTVHPPIIPAGANWHAALVLRDTARAVILAQSGEPDATVR